jgi:hypothetical protein
MRMWAIGTAGATLLTAGFVAFGAGPALADVTNGNDSILGGNQVNAPISIPVNASGNSVAVLGRALAGSTGGAFVQGARSAGGHNRTSGRHSILGGNQINAPVNACGNSVAAIGGALSGCQGGAGVHRGGYADGGHDHTSGVGSIGGGNQVDLPINAPVNVCGNAAAVLGDALSACKGGAHVHGGHLGGAYYSRTSGRHSVLGGNQVHAPINAPIDVCGNAVGNALAACRGGAVVHGGHGYPAGYGHGRHDHTSGFASIAGGNQVHAPVAAPVDVCGNAAAVLGRTLAACQGTTNVTGYGYGYGPHGRTSGRYSVGGGNQVYAPVNAPIDVCGNAAAVVGHAIAACQGGARGHVPGSYVPNPGYGPDDCPPGTYPTYATSATSARQDGLPSLPVDTRSLRDGALPVPLGATPALPKLPGRELMPQSARAHDPLGNDLGLPSVGGPPKPLPPTRTQQPLPPKPLPALNLAAAESATTPGSQSGALLALALGGMFAASAGTVTMLRRLGRRTGR